MTDLWTKTDFENGMCREDQVGVPVYNAPEQPTVEMPDEPLVVTGAAAALAKERGIKPTDAMGMLLIAMEVDSVGFRENNQALYKYILEVQQRQLAADAEHAQDMVKMTVRKFNAMDTVDILQKLLAGAIEEPGILAKWGISAEELTEMANSDLDSHLGFAPLSPPVDNQNGVYRVAPVDIFELPRAVQAPLPEPAPPDDRPTWDVWHAGVHHL